MYSAPKFPKLPEVSRECREFIKGLLVKNPMYRIGALGGIKEIRSHPWVRGFKEEEKKENGIFNFEYKDLCISAK
jgi:hypothetical protein